MLRARKLASGRVLAAVVSCSALDIRLAITYIRSSGAALEVSGMMIRGTIVNEIF